MMKPGVFLSLLTTVCIFASCALDRMGGVFRLVILGDKGGGFTTNEQNKKPSNDQDVRA